MQNVIGLLTALLGSAGFALIFNVRKQLLPLAALGGVVCWGVYLLAGCATKSVFLQSFAASAATAVWSEVLARVKKTPAQQYLILRLLPVSYTHLPPPTTSEVTHLTVPASVPKHLTVVSLSFTQLPQCLTAVRQV